MRQEFYTPEEIAQIRAQWKRASEIMREAIRARGVKVHPRIAEAKRQRIAPFHVEQNDSKEDTSDAAH